jgi:serine/threonine protein kinase
MSSAERNTPTEAYPGPGETWEALAGRLEAFVAAWEAADAPPELGAFLPPEPAAPRRLALVELIKVDLDYRWRLGKGPRKVETYLREFPELAGGPFPCDLLYEEYHVRRQAGDAVTPESYYQRFPDQAPQLARLLGEERAGLTTALVRTGRRPDLEAGERLDDFDLLTRLGQGAFAQVFLARQRSLQRLVALKVSADQGAEPQTLAQLDHPSIVRVYDQRVLPDRGLRLLYMQYVPGGTLQDVIAAARQVPPAGRSGRTLLEAVDRALEARGEAGARSALRDRLAGLPWPEVVCWVGARLAGALEHAHGLGVLHRDVKPANVLLTAEGLPKLADFNVSCCSKLEGAGPAAYFGGSLAYMSPEQLEAFSPAHPRTADSLDGRSDVYSLGVLLWELLAMRRPFPDEPLAADYAETVARLLARRRAGVGPAEAAALPPDCPPGLEAVLRTCLAPEPADRFPSAGAVAGQLALCLNPQARRLFFPPGRGGVRLVRRLPTAAVLLAAVVPNALLAVFNFAYNRHEIIDRLRGSAGPFWTVQLLINATAFPLALVLLALLTRPVAAGLRGLRRGQVPPPERAAALRRRCLRLGHYAALLGVADWLAAGLAYPVALSAYAGALPVSVYLHFVCSLGLCGLMAAAYPFFAITFLAVRALYPALAEPGTGGVAEAAQLERLSRLLPRYLALAASVPLLGVAVLVLAGSRNELALAVLSAGGLAGFGLAYGAFRLIQDGLAALRWALAPPGEVLELSIESYSSGGSGARR